MAIETTKWDAVEFLTSDEAIAAYLEAAFEDGDPKTIAVALGDITKAKGMSAIARGGGVTREALYKSLSDRGDPQAIDADRRDEGARAAVHGGQDGRGGLIGSRHPL